MLILGIESSCDETAVALYDDRRGLLAHDLFSQIALHALYGGVVPELASRDHIRRILPLLKNVITKAGCVLEDIDAVAYTKGPGLVGALLVGTAVAVSLAWSLGVPTLPVNHLEAHMLAVYLEDKTPEFPFLCLLVSGGHTMLIKVSGVGNYELLGQTLDDAVGEAFDKVAKMLQLPYPGGPAIEKLAQDGDPLKFVMPRPMLHRGLDFSFSGLKTHVLQLVKSHNVDAQVKANIAAGFQTAVVDTLLYKVKKAMQQSGCQRLVIAGGVGANKYLRDAASAMAIKNNFEIFYPDKKWCTDNAAMIAVTGSKRFYELLELNYAISVLPRWPIF
jgi:N6-L-threonylcarbamoyladenine synthase